MRSSSLALLVMTAACGPAQVEAPPPPAPSPSASASPAVASSSVAPAPAAPPCESVAMAWSATLVPDPKVEHLAVSQGALWLASDETIYVSADDGATFDARALELPSLDPSRPPAVLDLAASQTTAYLVTDAHVLVGPELATSLKLAFAPTETRAGAIAPSPIADLWAGDDGAVLLEKNGTVRRSGDWSPLEGLPSPRPPALAVAGNADGYLYVADEGGLLVSPNGTSWSRRTLPEAGQLVVGRGGSAMLHGEALHHSADGGASWRTVEAPPTITALAGGRCQGEWMVAAGAELSLSRDEGASFSGEPLAVSAPIEKGRDLTVTTLWRGDQRGFGLGQVTIGRETRPVLLIAQPR